MPNLSNFHEALTLSNKNTKRERSLCLNIPTVWDGMIQLFDVLGQHSKDLHFVEYKSEFDPIASSFNEVGANILWAINKYEKEIDG